MEGGYCKSLTKYQRRDSIEVHIGNVALGGNNPIRIQSMTTTDTMDTRATVDQSIRMIQAGCEYVRITAPSIKEAENLANIKKMLVQEGFDVPLIADIHFTPNAAEVAARIVEKIRINPGNYADKKKFQQLEYTDQEYNGELERIRDKFIPLVKICKEYGTAMRIGTNHGSLSDRIMSRYGDTPMGMVESALEFLRICEDQSFYNIVLSMKASNTRVMVQAYRLLVKKMEEEGLKAYPLHLGVTEAGEAEDGRIKSAVGIGTLLEDGLGDTIRVSLTEEPEYEIPVARDLVNRYLNREGHEAIKPVEKILVDPYSYTRRNSIETGNIGGNNVPRVIADVSSLHIADYADLACVGHVYDPVTDKFKMLDQGADYIYTGKTPAGFELPNGLKEIMDYDVWVTAGNKRSAFPLISGNRVDSISEWHPEINFVSVGSEDLHDDVLNMISKPEVVLVLETTNHHGMADQRRICFELMEKGITNSIIIHRSYEGLTSDQLLLFSSTDVGGLLTDGFGDGMMLSMTGTLNAEKEILKKQIAFCNTTSFGILQAARTRMSKTEYISCPSCGRTLFDLQETTAMIRAKTDHLKGVKIGIMGCIVNGPGEMADADYGYVGSGKGKITLYRSKDVIKRNVPAGQQALQELIDIIREDGKWTDPE